MLKSQSGFLNDLSEVHISDATKNRLKFQYLPAYAKFLLDSKLPELAVDQLDLSREFNLPILSYLSKFTEDELIHLGKEGLTRLLAPLSKNQALSYIEISIKEWLNNQLPQISRNQIKADDITLISLIRRTLFRKYIHLFSSDIKHCIAILNEVDTFTSESETISLKLLFTLQQSLYEQTQQLAKIGNWVWDLNTNSFTWSDELFKIYELENTNLTEIDIASFNHPDDDSLIKHHMETSKITKEPHDFYYRIVLPGGREKTLHAKGQVLVNSLGIAEKMFGTLQDFTAQNASQKELEENQRFVKKITDLTPSLITVYNIQTGEYLYINKAIETLLAYDTEDIREKGISFFTEIIHPEDLERIQIENAEAVQHANDNEYPNPEFIKEFIYRIRHKNGNYRWFSTYGTVFERDRFNKVLKVINISVDVTDQVNANSLLQQRDKEIKHQDERYFRMINEVEDYAILRLSKDGIIENWNNGAEKIKGYRADEIVGNHFRIFYSAEDQKNMLPEHLMEKAGREGKALHEGWRFRKDKTRFWGSILITAIHDDDGSIVGYSKVTRDLTQKKLADEKLKSHIHDIEEQNKQLESFNYIASHDLQEPLRKIRMFIERLKDKETLKGKVLETMSNIESACVRMQALIDGLLLYCQADMVEGSKEVTDLNLLIDEVLIDYKELIVTNEMTIQKSGLPQLPVNRLQLRQVFYNIISNAVKYKKSTEPLKLIITHSLKEKYNSNLERNIKYHLLSFADNGIGFSQQYVDKIFGLFQRLHDRSSYAGTGLGLAICKKIIENHGGEITASGVPGVGAEFCVYLPAED